MIARQRSFACLLKIAAAIALPSPGHAYMIKCDSASIANIEAGITKMALPDKQRKRAMNELHEAKRLLAANKSCDGQLKKAIESSSKSSPGWSATPN